MGSRIVLYTTRATRIYVDGRYRMNQSEKILALLEKAGDRGVLNTSLNQIAFRYGARLHELRKQGYMISTIYVAPGLFRFVLHEED